MRQLKFRVWNGEQMISPDYISRTGTAWWRENSIPTSSEIVMQFTGLLDVNGKEIYEGDVLKCRGLNIFQVVVVDDIRSIPVQVSMWPTVYGQNNGSCEIIGNIFEHPNLIEHENT